MCLRIFYPQAQVVWDADSALTAMDTNMDGVISYDEFQVCLPVCENLELLPFSV